MERAFSSVSLPPIVAYEKSVYNESDAVNVFVLEIAQRCILIFGEMYPELHLQYQQEWTYFPGKDDSDASIDLLWRVELHGIYYNVALSEFKRPHSIDIGEWEKGVGIFSRMGTKARENSQQITRYLFLTVIPFAQFCDLINTVSIALKESPNSMHKKWDKDLGEWIDEDTRAEVMFTKQATIQNGDSLVRDTLYFLWEALRRQGFI